MRLVILLSAVGLSLAGRGQKGLGGKMAGAEEECAEGSCDGSMEALATAARKGESVTACSQCYADGYSHCIVIEEKRPLEDFCLCEHQLPRGCYLDALPGLRTASLCVKAQPLPTPPRPLLLLVEDSSLTFSFPHLRRQPFWRSLQLSDYAFYALFNPVTAEQQKDCEPVDGDADFVCQAQIPAILSKANETSEELKVELARAHFPPGREQAFGLRYSLRVRRERTLRFRRRRASIGASDEILFSPPALVYQPETKAPEAKGNSAAAWLLPLLACLALLVAVACCLKRSGRWPWPSRRESAQEAPVKETKEALLRQTSPEAEELRELLSSAPLLLMEQVQIREAVGEGRFGPVHKARCPETEEDLHLHNAPSPLRMSSADLRDFLVLLDASLRAGQHPNLLGLSGICDEEESLLVCVREGSGPNLQSLLRESRTLENFPDYAAQHKVASLMPAVRLFGLMIGITRGVAHLEEREVIHPHLATVNVVVGEGGRPQIGGFGFANLGDVWGREAEKRHCATRWLAPEALAALGVAPARVELSTATMVWSLGMILWEVLTLGGTPYHELSTEQLRSLVLRAEIAPSQPPHVTDALYAVLADCWRADASERVTALQSLQALQDLQLHPADHIDLRTVDGLFPYTPIRSHLEQEL